MKVMITEKPSVARDIARVLGATSKKRGYLEGNGYRVAWCFGHMVRLCDPERYDTRWKSWTRTHLPMIPEAFSLEPIASSKDQLSVLRTLLCDKSTKQVINACDAGREGELIFRYVYDLTGSTKPVSRLWLASMTDTAIRQALGSLKPGAQYDALADAARCRSEADWLVGLNGTRAMTLQCRAAGASELMSVGRVQTPTLAMIVEREAEIEAFVPEDFWQVYARFDVGEQPQGIEPSYEGAWHHKRTDRTYKKEQAEGVVAEVEGGEGEVVKVTQKDVRERPPYLFDLTGLQREANRRFNFSAQHTLDVAQALYERHKLLTYPRTDSNYLTSDMKKELPSVVRVLGDLPVYKGFSDHLLGALPLRAGKRVINDKEVGDHHAIIPTDRSPQGVNLTSDEKRLYDLVARRFLGAFYPDAIFATTKIATKVGPHMFVTSGKVRREAGWQQVDPPPKYKRSKGKKAPDPVLPDVKVRDRYPVGAVRLHQGQTQPPKRYSENALLGAMERAGAKLEDDVLRRAMKESGLGTPATRASTIETLLGRAYLERSGKVLTPTLKGRALIDAIPSDSLKSAALTGSWEARLERVARGELERVEFMKSVKRYTHELIAALLGSEVALPEALLEAQRSSFGSNQHTLGACPVCGEDVFETPKVYMCRTGRECSFVIFKKVAKRPVSASLVKLLIAGKTSKRLKGFKSRAGKKFEAALRLDEQGRVVFSFDDDDRGLDRASRAPAEPERAEEASKKKTPKKKDENQGVGAIDADVACPRCQQGQIIRGKKGWGCDRWREGCRFVVWFDQHGVTLDDRQGASLIGQGATAPIEALGGQRLVLRSADEGAPEVVLEST